MVTDCGYHKRDQLFFQLYIPLYSYSFLQPTDHHFPLALQTLFEAANLVFDYDELNAKLAEYQMTSVTEENQHRLAQLTGGHAVSK